MGETQPQKGTIFFEASVYALNILNSITHAKGVTPITIAYTNKTFGQNIDSNPTRFLCSCEYTSEEALVSLRTTLEEINNSRNVPVAHVKF